MEEESEGKTFLHVSEGVRSRTGHGVSQFISQLDQKRVKST